MNWAKWQSGVSVGVEVIDLMPTPAIMSLPCRCYRDGDALRHVWKTTLYIVPRRSKLPTDMLIQLEEEGLNVVPTRAQYGVNREASLLAAEELQLPTSTLYHFADNLPALLKVAIPRCC